MGHVLEVEERQPRQADDEARAFSAEALAQHAESRYPSSTLFPFFLGRCVLMKAEQLQKGHQTLNLRVTGALNPKP